MTRRASADFFERKYRQDPDPWKFSTDSYEQHRYESILGQLRGRFFMRAFEPGCSMGVLTAKLAPFCKSLFAMDIAPSAIRSAKVHCRDLSNVTFLCGSVATEIPAGAFDLIVFSEIGYYFDGKRLGAIARKLIRKLSANGSFLAAHWLGVSRDHLLSGDEVHRVLHALPGLHHVSGERHTGFRLDHWERA